MGKTIRLYYIPPDAPDERGGAKAVSMKNEPLLFHGAIIAVNPSIAHNDALISTGFQNLSSVPARGSATGSSFPLAPVPNWSVHIPGLDGL